MVQVVEGAFKCFRFVDLSLALRLCRTTIPSCRLGEGAQLLAISAAAFPHNRSSHPHTSSCIASTTLHHTSSLHLLLATHSSTLIPISISRQLDSAPRFGHRAPHPLTPPKRRAWIRASRIDPTSASKTQPPTVSTFPFSSRRYIDLHCDRNLHHARPSHSPLPTNVNL